MTPDGNHTTDHIGFVIDAWHPLPDTVQTKRNARMKRMTKRFSKTYGGRNKFL